MLHFGKAQNDDDLRQILALQQQNLFKNIMPQQQQEQGFVTVEHSLESLRQMNDIVPQVIAKNDDELAGYALAMSPSMANLIPELRPMFAIFDEIEYQNRPVSSLNYYVMGQICVAEGYRGQGVFDGLYEAHRQVFSEKFDVCITEVAVRNTRSIRAHERVGFETIHTYEDHLDVWNVVAWNFKK